MCRSYGDQFEILLKDKRDISSYLKKQLELRNEQVFDLNDRLIGLQQAKDYEKDLYEKKLQNFKEKHQLEIEKLENENMLLRTRLVALEEFEYQRQTMEKTIDDLKNLILAKEDAYKKALDEMEIALIVFKNRLKKEAIEYLNDLAIEFRHNTKNQMSNTIKRAIHENFYLNNQIDYLSNQLEKSIEINKKYTEDNQHLTRTVAILEDVEIQSAKKYIAIENSQDDNNETLKIEKRNDMLEQLLSLLLISHHLGGTSLPLQKKSPFLKGIFPGSRLGLHGIHPNSSTKTNTHYCRGDLGIVPHDNYIENTHSN
ncbi:unnamed protein product [Rotaria sordida]|uniref:Cilia- and flagella-associated protein 157 n=1 Tax=Rotaria sordida TaxID=392033 RepID=A0A814SVS0_9BILA|nr:unnamed protein product [Rotaria sordida]